MPVAPHTNELMRRLPPGLRPNPYNIDEEVINLVGRGWTIDDIFQRIMGDKPTQPGNIVALLRRVIEEPAPIRASIWKYGHEPCNNPMHVDCEICRCHKGKILHHVSVPMPSDFPRKRIGRTI